MEMIFFKHAWEDYLYWQRVDRKTANRINQLIKAIIHEPYAGIGKPESLRHGLFGYWSRRITEEHRTVYKADNHDRYITQLRYHY